MSASAAVQKPWDNSNGPGPGRSQGPSPARKHAGSRVNSWLTLRDDAMSYSDYVEQLAGPLIFERDDERSRPLSSQPSPNVAASGWPVVLADVRAPHAPSQCWRL